MRARRRHTARTVPLHETQRHRWPSSAGVRPATSRSGPPAPPSHRPRTSTLTPYATAANLVLTGVTDRTVNVRIAAGTTHVLVDIVGYDTGDFTAWPTGSPDVATVDLEEVEDQAQLPAPLHTPMTGLGPPSSERTVSAATHCASAVSRSPRSNATPPNWVWESPQILLGPWSSSG